MLEPSILKPGINCWRIEKADRLSFLVDGAAYFQAFRETAKNAQHSIMIVGWDVDSRFKLTRGSVADGLPASLGDFLNALLSRRKSLQIYVLDWDFSIVAHNTLLKKFLKFLEYKLQSLAFLLP